MLLAKSLQIKILLAFAAIYIIWGTTYLAVRIGITTIPPFLMGAARYLIASIIFLGYATFKNEKVFKASILKNMLLGAIMLTGGQAILFWAEKYISSGFTAILVATEPVWFILLDRPQWHYYFKNKFIWIGIAAGFTGIIVLFENLITDSSSKTQSSLPFIASMFTLISALLWTGGSLYFKYNKPKGSMYLNLGWQLIGGVCSCLLVSFLMHEWQSFIINNISVKSLFAVFYLAIAGSIIAFGCYNWLLTQKPAAVVGTYAYINPVIAVLVGSMLAKEQIPGNQIAGMIIILISAYFINNSGPGTKVNV